MNTRYYGYEFHKKDTLQDAGFKRFVEKSYNGAVRNSITEI